jgi:uncharacterized protein YqgV (UPF0045/DUF77 family)
MVGIAAQVSIYPLRQPALSPAIDAALQVFEAFDLGVDAGPMSTVVTGEDQAVFAALREAFLRVTEQGEVVMVVTMSNACPLPAAGWGAAGSAAGTAEEMGGL